nr:hypothetical protein [Mycobacterium sp.]
MEHTTAPDRREPVRREAISSLGGSIAPRDTPYGVCEFAYVDPDGTVHRGGAHQI